MEVSDFLPGGPQQRDNVSGGLFDVKGESSVLFVSRRDQPGMPILARGAEPEHVVGIHEDAAAIAVRQVDPGHVISPNGGLGE
jgi:hypothetical protein